MTHDVMNTYYTTTQIPVVTRLPWKNKMMVNKTSSKYSPEYDMDLPILKLNRQSTRSLRFSVIFCNEQVSRLLIREPDIRNCLNF